MIAARIGPGVGGRWQVREGEGEGGNDEDKKRREILGPFAESVGPQTIVLNAKIARPCLGGRGLVWGERKFATSDRMGAGLCRLGGRESQMRLQFMESETSDSHPHSWRQRAPRIPPSRWPLLMALCDTDRCPQLLARRLCASIFVVCLLASGAVAEESDRPPSFVNDIMPLLTKAGCNSGVCHAKAGGGQNGFQLSLLGFEPQEDFEHLAREGRGRRLFPAAPDRSLLLQKASGRVPHGGGVRLQPESQGYALLRKWIDQGTPNSDASDPVLRSVEVQPPRGTVQKKCQQQLTALAHYSDGSIRDVTQLALYESNDRAMAEVTEAGLVRRWTYPARSR